MNNFWKELWDSKGMSEQNDLLFLDGYEHLKGKVDSKVICRGIASSLGMKRIRINPRAWKDSVLEVGCGAGLLARELSKDYKYTGIDYSEPMIRKHLDLFPLHRVSVSEANHLPFADNSVDYAFCFGVYQYLPSEEYAMKMISEMKRVSRKGILMGDLKDLATREHHLPCPREKIKDLGFSILEPFYLAGDSTTRYNALLR